MSVEVISMGVIGSPSTPDSGDTISMQVVLRTGGPSGDITWFRQWSLSEALTLHRDLDTTISPGPYLVLRPIAGTHDVRETDEAVRADWASVLAWGYTVPNHKVHLDTSAHTVEAILPTLDTTWQFPHVYVTVQIVQVGVPGWVIPALVVGGIGAVMLSKRK